MEFLLTTADGPRRWLSSFSSGVCVALLSAFAVGASAQTRLASVALPEDPGYALQQAATPAQDNSGVVEGTVTDAQGDLVPGAIVTLEGKGHTNLRETTTDAAGHYLFTGVTGGTYTVLASAHNLKTSLSQPIVELPGQHNELPPIALAVAASTTVDVSANSEQVAEQELDLETKQRVLGIVPNFFTSYVYDAAPLNTRQKFKLTARSVFDPVSFLSAAATAGAEQYEDTFPSWGNSDAASYGKRYAAAFGDDLLTRTFSYAIYPTVFHQDPRYFYLGPSYPKRKRIWHALSQGILTRGDNGKTELNYSHMLGAATGGALSSFYHPASDGPGLLAGINLGVSIGGFALDGLFREFVWTRFTTHVPSSTASATPAADSSKP